MESCIYEGRVRHRRTKPVAHEFDFRLFMLYLDLQELPRLFEKRWLWSSTGPALARFRREDHLGDPKRPLDVEVRDLVEAKRGQRPQGPIRLLTHLRYLGYVFNPVSFYYCFDRAGESVEAVVAEVTNTPWNERHCYVVEGGSDQTPKEFHVSPFMGMEQRYRWTLHAPGDELKLGIQSDDAEQGRLFGAALSMQRVELSTASMARVLLRYPLVTAQVFAGIYWQAFRLRRKGVAYLPHPGELRETQMEIAS